MEFGENSGKCTFLSKKSILDELIGRNIGRMMAITPSMKDSIRKI
jgi:hypothetical protein